MYTRAIGIILILAGLGVWIASGYICPTGVQRKPIEPDILLLSDPKSSNWSPYVGGALFVIGMFTVAAAKTRVDNT